MPLKEIKDDELSDSNGAAKPSVPLPAVDKEKSAEKETSAEDEKSVEKKKPGKAEKTEAKQEPKTKSKAKQKPNPAKTKKEAVDKQKTQKLPVLKKPAASAKGMKRPAAASDDGKKTVVSAHRKYYNRDNTTGILVKYSDGTQQQMLVARTSFPDQRCVLETCLRFPLLLAFTDICFRNVFAFSITSCKCRPLNA